MCLHSSGGNCTNGESCLHKIKQAQKGKKTDVKVAPDPIKPIRYSKTHMPIGGIVVVKNR